MYRPSLLLLMLLFSTYRVMWIWHGVEWSNTQRIFIQNEEVCVILLFDKFAQQLFIWSAKREKCRFGFVTCIQHVKTIHRIQKAYNYNFLIIQRGQTANYSSC